MELNKEIMALVDIEAENYREYALAHLTRNIRYLSRDDIAVKLLQWAANQGSEISVQLCCVDCGFKVRTQGQLFQSMLFSVAVTQAINYIRSMNDKNNQ